MTALPDTESVRNLLDSLEPTCEARDFLTDEPCGQPAEFLVWLVIDGQPTRKLLHCATHHAIARRHYNGCRWAREKRVEFHAEPLRGGS